MEDGGQQVLVLRCKHAGALHWLADKLYVSAWRTEGSGCRCHWVQARWSDALVS
jgi:hypothetical protein